MNHDSHYNFGLHWEEDKCLLWWQWNRQNMALMEWSRLLKQLDWLTVSDITSLEWSTESTSAERNSNIHLVSVELSCFWIKNLKLLKVLTERVIFAMRNVDALRQMKKINIHYVFVVAVVPVCLLALGKHELPVEPSMKRSADSQEVKAGYLLSNVLLAQYRGKMEGILCNIVILLVILHLAK